MEGLQKKNKKRKKEKKHINNDDSSFDLFQDPFNTNETTPITTNSGLNPNTMMQICGEMSLSDLGELEAISNFPTLGLTLPIFRTGKWYYEVEIITSGIMQVFNYIYIRLVGQIMILYVMKDKIMVLVMIYIHGDMMVVDN